MKWISECRYQKHLMDSMPNEINRCPIILFTMLANANKHTSTFAETENEIESMRERMRLQGAQKLYVYEC